MKNILWLTGLPCSGKTTLSMCLSNKILQPNVRLDGDDLRLGLSNDLDFSAESRKENTRRVASVSKLLSAQDIIPIVSILAPLNKHRLLAQDILGESMKIIYLRANLDVCEKRDVKGMYKKARMGVVKNFTGVDDLFEKPNNADLVLDTSTLSVEECADRILDKFISS